MFSLIRLPFNNNNLMTQRRLLNIGLLLTLFVAFVASCTDEPLPMDDAFIKSFSYAQTSDGTPIEMSTFRLDSVQTSNQNTVWVGKANKPVIGDIHSVSYMKLAEPVLNGGSSGYGWLQNGKEVYDSVTMVLVHNGLYEGDTTQLFNIQIKCLGERLDFGDQNENAFYNVRSFKQDSVLGETSFYPRPHTRPRVRFRLNDTFGRSLRDFVRDSAYNKKSDIVSQLFDQYFKGICITSSDDKHDTKALLSFIADSCKITLHSHKRGMEAVRCERDFYMNDKTRQFNEVWNENVEEPFDKLDARWKQAAEDSSGHHSVLYEGLGYYTRINLKSLQELKNLNRYQHVVKAVLKIYPEVGSYDKRRVPTSFYVAEVNKGNVITNALYNGSGRRVYSTLVYDAYDRSQMYYYADITYYINTLLTQEVFDEYTGLLLLWGQSMSPTTYEFMVFNGNGVDRNRSKLEITFYNYDFENR